VIRIASSLLARTSLIWFKARASETAGINAVVKEIVIIIGIYKRLFDTPSNCPKTAVA